MLRYLLTLGIFPAALSVPFPTATAIAQELRWESEKELALKGSTLEQVRAVLGTPDAERNEAEGATSWVYGRSLVFFRNGRVTAWSNAGELEKRRNLARVAEDQGTEYEEFSSSWKNDWTPQKAQKPEHVLRELMGADGNVAIGQPENYSSKSKSKDAGSEPTLSTDGSESKRLSP